LKKLLHIRRKRTRHLSQWRAPDGTLVRERSYVVELLLTMMGPDVEARVQRV